MKEDLSEIVARWRKAPADEKSALRAAAIARIKETEASILEARASVKYFLEPEPLRASSSPHPAEYYCFPILDYFYRHPQDAEPSRSVLTELLCESVSRELDLADLARVPGGQMRWQAGLKRAMSMLTVKKMLVFKPGVPGRLTDYGMRFYMFARTQYVVRTRPSGAITTNFRELVRQYHHVFGSRGKK